MTEARPRGGEIKLWSVLLAIIAIGVVVALLLPATQSAREAAKRVAVANNLRQLNMDYAARDATKSVDPALASETSAGMPETKAAAGPKMPTRKIIYTADIDLTVTDFDKAERELTELVKAEHGYFAQAGVTGTPGMPRRGTWKARIPVDRFDGFRTAVQRLGELQRSVVHADDVSEEFYDLEARINNKKVEEARLLKHLEQSTGTLKDTLAVEHELARVREEAEREQGRMNLLASLTAMTTVTITIDSLVTYKPESFPR
jgi:hypothetical protein